MGIELPAELRGVAEKVGARWPEADEDAMRTSATTWRDTASSIESLASSADGAAQGGLTSLQGAAGDAAGREWKGVIGEDGPLPVSAKECTAAADRLEHAADQIGAAKVRMVRELVAVAKQVDAAEQAAGLGNPQALGGLDTVLRGASAGLAQVHDTLSSAVDIDSGVTMEGAGAAGGLLGAAGGVTDVAGGLAGGVGATASGVAGTAGDTVAGVAGAAGATANGAAGATASGVADAAGGAVGGVAGAAGEAVGGATQAAGGVATGVGASAGGAVGGVADAAVGGVTEAVGNTANTVGGAVGGVGESVSDSVRGATGLPESTVEGVGRGGGIGEALAPPGGPGQGIGRPDLGSPGNSEHTGPISIGNGQASAPGWGGGAESTGPVAINPSDPVTSPQSVQSAWAASPGPAAGAMPGAVAPVPPPAPQVPQGPPPSIGGFQGGGAAGPPPAAGGQHGGAVAQPPRPAQPFRPQQPMYGVAPPQPAPQAPAPQPPARAMYRPAPQPPPVAAPPPVQQHDAVRPSRAPARSEAAVAFVLHQFPIGYMPVAASRSSRQLPLPSPENDPAAGLRFPPQDHPRSSLVDDRNALSRTGSGAAPITDGEPREVPAELVDKHDPLGELTEVEWERRFLTQPENGVRHHVWRASTRFPEGCVESGEPIVLGPDTVIDRFGDGEGRVFAPEGTAVAQRSVPPEHVERGYRRYRVMRPLPVWQGVSASWFGQPGGGLRYRATYPLAELVALGFVVELTPDVEFAEAHTVRITVDQAEVAPVENTEQAQRKDGE